MNLNLISNLANSHLKINGSLNDENADIKIVSNRFSLEDCIKYALEHNPNLNQNKITQQIIQETVPIILKTPMLIPELNQILK